MTQLHDLIIRCSQSARLFIGITLTFALSLFLLLQLSQSFAEATGGFEPFDMQSDLDANVMDAQLQSYSPRSHTLYRWFTLVDYAFPFLGGFCNAALGAFFLRHTLPTVYTGLVTRRSFMWLMLPTLFDWMENVATLMLINIYPPLSTPLAGYVLRSKWLKLNSLFLAQGAVVLLGVYWLLNSAIGLLRSKRSA